MPGMLRKSTAFVPRYQKFESISPQRRVRCELDLGEGGFADEIAAREISHSEPSALLIPPPCGLAQPGEIGGLQQGAGLRRQRPPCRPSAARQVNLNKRTPCRYCSPGDSAPLMRLVYRSKGATNSQAV